VSMQSTRWFRGKGDGGPNASPRRSKTQSSAPAASTAPPGDRNHCSISSPRVPTISSRTTLLCFGDGPVLRGALIVQDASSVAMIPFAKFDAEASKAPPLQLKADPGKAQ